MRFVDVNPQNPFSRIYTEHRGEQIQWNLDFYKRNKTTTESVFHYVNNYLAHLPEAKQGEIFAVYRSMREQIDRVIDPDMLHNRLSNKVKELYRLIPFASIQEYVSKHENIKIPPEIMERYEELGISERSQNYREQTYLRDDYRDLVNLAIYLRFMIPIWAEFAEIVDRKHKNHFREYRAMALMNRSAVMKTKPMDRLRNYIERILDADQKQSSNSNSNMFSAVLGGLGSSEMPDWMLSAVVIRRLVTVELSSVENAGNVVSKVYRYITNQNRSINRKFSGVIKDKNQNKLNRSTEDGEKFIIETYKIKQELSDGDLSVLSIYAENPHAMIARIDPEVPLEMVNACYEAIMKEREIEFSHGQLTILRWIMAPIMPPRSVENLKKQSLLSTMAVAQATLWYREYYDLAKLLTAQRLLDEHGFLIGGSDSYRRIPKELVDLLEYHFPFSGERNEKDRSRQTNVAIRTIDRVTRDFVRSDWRLVSPKQLIPLGSGVNEDGTMVAPQYLRVQLAQYILSSSQAQENHQLPIWDTITTL